MTNFHIVDGETYRDALMSYWVQDRAGTAPVAKSEQEKRERILERTPKLGGQKIDQLIDLAREQFEADGRPPEDFQDFVHWLEESVKVSIPAGTKAKIASTASPQSSPQADGGEG